MTNMNKTLIYGGLGVLAVGGIAYYVRQSQLLSSFGYELISITYLGTQDNASKIEVKMQFTNTADFRIKIKGYDFDVFVGDTKVANAKDDTQEYILEPKQSAIIPFVGTADTSLSLSMGITALVGYFFNDLESNATLRGTIDIQAGIVTINNLPLEFSATTGELINELKS